MALKFDLFSWFVPPAQMFLIFIYYEYDPQKVQ